MKIKSLDGLMLEVQFRRNNLSNKYLAKLSLDGLGGNLIVAAPRSTGKGNLRCLTKSCKNIDGRRFYNISKQFADCYSNSVGKNGRIKGDYWGKRAWAKVRFNEYGDYISHEIVTSSRDERVDKVMDKVAKGMENCEISHYGKKNQKKREEVYEAHYEYLISAGDIVVSELDIKSALKKIKRRLSEKRAGFTKSDSSITSVKRVPIDDPEYLKYQAAVRRKILEQWVVPGSLIQIPSAKRPNVRIIVAINDNGDVISKRWSKKSNLDSLNASAMNAIEKASPFPIPPKKLGWEALNEGFLVEFSAR